MHDKIYRDYFNINPKYYAAVTAELIRTGKVKWDAFFPHETFIKLLEKTHIMLSGVDPRSLWVEGAYGTGKSHAALTVKSMLEASEDEIRAYFREYGLQEDLCQKLITDKANCRLITIHRIGSASIRSDQDLILAIQDSISAALREHGIENRGEASLRDAALKWFGEREANRKFFEDWMQDDQFAFEFGGQPLSTVIASLESEDPDTISHTMRKILMVAEKAGITALRLDVQSMCDWIKSVLQENRISILFVWDEFTEYFINNQNALTGFQTLTEISASHPFYFMLVTHESSTLIQDKDMRRKIMNRFVGDSAIRITMPENMAFRLMAQAMKETDDPVLLPEWKEYKAELNQGLADVRRRMITEIRNQSTMGEKTILSDAELQSIFPIHPYAGLMLKHMSVAFNSNARSMFDFIISNDVTDAKGFKWFIGEYGPLDTQNLLTIDMLWDFFNGKSQSGLSDNVRVILDSYSLLKAGSLTPDQTRVFKSLLLMEALTSNINASERIGASELLRPNEQNIDLAFSGTGWPKGKARSIAAGLCQQGLLFEKPVGGGMKEYTVANYGGDMAKIEKLKSDIRGSIRTQDLIVTADLLTMMQLPAPIRTRYILEAAAHANFTQTTGKLNGQNLPNRFKAVACFSLSDAEASMLKNDILKAVVQPANKLFYIESTVPMGEDLLTQYVENMAYSKNYAQNDKQRAAGFEEQARKCLEEWGKRIKAGAFLLYTPEQKSGIRAANLNELHEELRRVNHQIYFCGLEQFRLADEMFMKGALAQGAECGIRQELKQRFRSANENTSLAAALKDAWQVERYWEDPAKKGLPIVRIKQEVNRVIQKGFQKDSGQISALSIFEALEKAPYGFMPNNVSAFVLGFVMKEYAVADYYWSNGSAAEPMTIDKMKQMIANAINQKYSPSAKYKEEYIRAMSAEQRNFLQCTAAGFQIPSAQCGSIESARDQIRIQMRKFSFPIWCLKYILETTPLKSPVEQLRAVIDAYCGIANTANGGKATESQLAERIGTLVGQNPMITADMETLLTDEMCRKGMLAYIGQYEGGILQQLATKIGDNGAYLNRVKRKFNTDAANWVWSQETADERISDVILEYRIIDESNQSLPKCTGIDEVVDEWNKRIHNIRIPYEILRKYAGELGTLLEQFYYMKQSGQLLEQNRQTFYETLLAQRESFVSFYKEQLPWFQQAADMFLEGLEEPDIRTIYNEIPSGQYVKSAPEYYQYIEKRVADYRRRLKKNRLKALWKKKTNTKDPADWSRQNGTPILCMFDDAERSEARKAFSVLLSHSPLDSEIRDASAYLENASFYDRLNDPAEIDRCFMERVVGDYAVMLLDAEWIRSNLSGSVADDVYDWMDNSAVQHRLRSLAEKQYQLGGCTRAQAVIDQMDAEQLRRYLNELIADHLMVGIEILRSK